METGYFNTFKRFFLFTILMFAVSGCGSSGSISKSSESGTGSIAAKLIWSSPGSKTTAKTLYAAPTGVTLINVFVYNASMQSIIEPNPKGFTVTPNTDGSGIIENIPAGVGHIIKFQGLGVGGVLRYQGIATVNVESGKTTTVPVTMKTLDTMASYTTSIYNTNLAVTLTSTPLNSGDPAASIYYTLDGTEPDINGNPKGTSPITIPITQGPSVTLKYFAAYMGLYEFTKSQTYNFVPVTTASLPGDYYISPQLVTLNASEPATIYYTTNGNNPTTTPSPTNISGPTPIENILIFGGTTLKFFAVDLSGARENVKFIRYSTPLIP